MTYQISGECIGCGDCVPQCPTGAIECIDDKLWINPALCNNCEGYFDEPQCVVGCETNAPVPFQPKKGRTKLIDTRPITSPDLFANGKSNGFASAIAIWEACNVLAQRQNLPWQIDATGRFYQRFVNQKRGSIMLRLTTSNDHNPPIPLTQAETRAALESFDIRSACLHLIYAAHALALEKPWEEEFVISDRQIETYLGLDKRKDLSKSARLNLIKALAQQPCSITVALNWSQQGKIRGFNLAESRLWHLLKIQHHFQEDEQGCNQLVGLTFKIRAGEWSRHFLNKQGNKTNTALYQYGSLPSSLLTTVMSIWQQHEGAARMMLWLLFKTRIGTEQRVMVPTLMRIAYGEQRLNQVSLVREERKRLIRTFESDLAVLHAYGLKPAFDPITYPPAIQPLWAKLADLPEDADEALDFWIQDASSSQRLTDPGPRNKWGLLMNARIVCFELPSGWEQLTTTGKKRQPGCSTTRNGPLQRENKFKSVLTGEQILAARKLQGWSQRTLAEETGKSQSWIRDVEKGRFQPKNGDVALLRKVLGLG